MRLKCDNKAPSLFFAWSATEARREVARLARAHGIAAFAVGGAVRDVLMGRTPHDWDVVCAQAMRLARVVADHLDATLVWLHDNPDTCRVVVGAHGGTRPREEIDFSDFRGADLEDDLRARDFTLNSLAWPLGAAEDELVDPCGGREDIRARLLRANSAGVLAEDPLRCLRAYRLAAELELDIEAATALWIGRHSPGLARIAGERVGAELLRLVAQRGLPGRLEQMAATGVLQAVMPEFLLLRGVTQGGYHHLDVWGHTLLVVEEVERIAAEPSAVFPAAAGAVAEYLDAPERLTRLKLAALLHDIAKPATRVLQDGAIRFTGHETEGAVMASGIAARLRLPRETRRAVEALTRRHMRPIMLIEACEPQQPTLSAVRRLFRDCAPDGPGVVILAAADLLACRGPATSPADQRRRLAVLDGMIAQHAQWRVEEQFEPLLRGRDLIADLGLEPGPHFSTILEAVEEAQVNGDIDTREEALALARQVAEGGGAQAGGE